MKLYETMSGILADAAARDRSIRFIAGNQEESVLPFAGLRDRALKQLGNLQAAGLEKGDELVVFTADNTHFVVAFWAALLGGIVPVPVAVGISDEHRYKLFRILRQLRRGKLLTDPELLQRLQRFASDNAVEDVAALLQTGTLLTGETGPAADGEPVAVAPDDPAFIQYSSGSTSDPKGVCLTHRNLCHNIRAIVEGAAWTGDDTSLSWMPLTHDMGLIGYHLSVLAAGMSHTVMDTNVFVRRPLLWLQRASELRATQLCSPNFGYKHFLKLFERKGLPAGTDLSCVKLILNGAEPISWELCEEFLQALAPLGMRRSAMFPVYGLAEATVGVSFGIPGDEPSRIIVDRHALRIGERYVEVAVDAPDAVSFVRCGRAIRDVEIRIADDSDNVLDAGLVGNIQLRGASVTERIYGDDETTAALFSADGWLRTGDCGAFADGQLVITGREKDLIIVNGQNYYPHDLEEILAGIDGLELGKVVVAGATPTGSGTEELLVFVLYRQDIDTFRPLADSIRSRLGEQAGLEVDHVLPVARIPKTTSGKVQRAHLLRDYADGAFAELLQKLAPAELPGDAGGDDGDLVAELVGICREFSKERTIGADDNLFEVGVSSLTLTEIVLAIDERYPGKVDISDLFDYPTLRELADFLGQQS